MNIQNLISNILLLYIDTYKFLREFTLSLALVGLSNLIFMNLEVYF